MNNFLRASLQQWLLICGDSVTAVLFKEYNFGSFGGHFFSHNFHQLSSVTPFYVSRNARKPVFRVSDKVNAVTEDGFKLEIILSM